METSAKASQEAKRPASAGAEGATESTAAAKLPPCSASRRAPTSRRAAANCAISGWAGSWPRVAATSSPVSPARSGGGPGAGGAEAVGEAGGDGEEAAVAGALADRRPPAGAEVDRVEADGEGGAGLAVGAGQLQPRVGLGRAGRRQAGGVGRDRALLDADAAGERRDLGAGGAHFVRQAPAAPVELCHPQGYKGQQEGGGVSWRSEVWAAWAGPASPVCEDGSTTFEERSSAWQKTRSAG